MDRQGRQSAHHKAECARQRQHLPQLSQATSSFQPRQVLLPDGPRQKSQSTDTSDPQKQQERITCPDGMDSKESEQPRAMGRSSGVRLSVDERLLARASSCTNMIPGETRGGRAGWAGRVAIQQTGLGCQATDVAGGHIGPPNPGTQITEENIKNGNLNLKERTSDCLSNLRAGTDFLILNPKEETDRCVTM